MNGACNPSLDLFVTRVASRLGIGIDQQNRDYLARVLQCRLERTGCGTADDYVQRFEDDPEFGRKEIRELVSALTVAESFFFRHPEQFEALREAVVPALLKGRKPGHQLRVLSAGCACGEEAYSLAAVLLKVPGIQEWNPRIWGIDINAELLQKARQGHYTEWSLRTVSEANRSGNFHRKGKDYVLDERLKSIVCFEERNLVEADTSCWQEAFFDIVFCRNVMIYFCPVAVRLLVARLAHSTAPGGFLFLGPSETLRGISNDFHLRHTHSAFYYQRLTAAERRASTHQAVANALASQPQPPSGDLDWAARIAGASHRIKALAKQSRTEWDGFETRLTEESSAAMFSAGDELEKIRRLLRQERFEDALHLLERLPAKAAADPDVLMLRAVLLVNRGELGQAEQVCGQLLVKDELRPGAHYLMAICHERRADISAAIESDRTAIYLDAQFAMPRLHFGLLSMRLGNMETARRELGEALELLAHEEAGRILLFGGGFSREALIRFCRAQWQRCGGTR